MKKENLQFPVDTLQTPKSSFLLANEKWPYFTTATYSTLDVTSANKETLASVHAVASQQVELSVGEQWKK